MEDKIQQAQEAYAPYRFTVRDYYRMAEVNILTEEDHVELVDGRIVVKEPPGPPHAGHVALLSRTLSTRIGDRAIIRSQDPIHIDELNHPEPDIAVVKMREDFYMREHPAAGDVLLLVETAWSSGAADRIIKAPLYARAGIPEFWLLDVWNQWLEFYRDPADTGYRRYERLARSAVVSPLAFPDVELAVGDILRPVTHTG